MNIYISTGDTSGEQHAAELIKATQQINPDIQFTAMGSDILRQHGIETPIDSSDIKIMGFVAVFKHLPKIYKIFHKVLDYIGSKKPDAIVLVDYPGFHLRLAKAIKKKYPSIPIIYYITPQVWAWKQKRVETIRKYVDHCLCILPFEPKWFEKRGVKATYVGNPVMDTALQADRTAVRKLLQIDEHARLISIFPGSRGKEMQYILPEMVNAAKILSDDFDDLAFAIAAAPGYTRSDLLKYADIPGHIPVLEGHNIELMAASHFCMAKSGTTTLEAALLGTPMLVAYKGDWLSARLAFWLLKTNNLRFVSLPNIIAGRPIVPEFLQEMCNGPELARMSRIMLRDYEMYDQMTRDLAGLKELIGTEPASQKAARELVNCLS